MRTIVRVCGIGLLAATTMFGCAHRDRIVRREIVQVVPAPVVERRETIVEAYYTAHVWRGLFASVDLQAIENPGYNRDRGPASLIALRAHVTLH